MKNKLPNRKRAKGLTDTSQKQKSKWPVTWGPKYEKALNLISHQENKIKTICNNIMHQSRITKNKKSDNNKC